MIRPSSKEADFRVAAALLGDFAIAWGSVALLVYIRRSIPLAFTRSLLPIQNLVLTPAMILLFAGSFVVGLGLSGFYRQRVTPRTRPVLFAALFIQLALVSLGSIASEQPLPRTVVFAVPVLEAILLPLWRRLLRSALPVRSRATVLVGDLRDIDDAVTSLRDSGDARVHIVAWATHDDLTIPSIRNVVQQAEEVILVSPDGEPRRRLELLRIRGPRGYLLLASHADALLTSSVFGWIGDQPLVEIAVRGGYGISAAVKRGVDIVVSALLILLTSPLWLVTTLAIWLEDRGPLTYRQDRVGRDGVLFEMWKFRSMRDERVTRIGALLRRYRIDELPQLLNVLIGDMSLVGPRPERPQIVARIMRDVPDFDLRSLVRPGIAGLAQVSSEYETHPEVKLRYDLTYMCDWSLWLDFRLLVRSVSTSLSGSGI